MARQTRPSHHRQSLWASLSSLLLSLGFAALAVVFHTLIIIPWQAARAARLRGGWASESVEEDSPFNRAGCDLLRIDAASLDKAAFERLYRGQRPLVLTSTSSPLVFASRRQWPFVNGKAKEGVEAWEKEGLLARHGQNLTVLVGGIELWEQEEVGEEGMMGLGLVKRRRRRRESTLSGTCESTRSSSGGGIRLPLAEYITRYFDAKESEEPAVEEENEEEEKEMEVARTALASWRVSDLPAELARAVQTPPQFRGWWVRNDEKQQQLQQHEHQQGETSHKDAHDHVRIILGKELEGKAWTASDREEWTGLLLGGSVLWSFYPPGQGLQNMTMPGKGHCLLGPLEWVLSTLDALVDHEGVSDPEEGRMDPPPLECWQRPGDVVYVPTGWKSMRVHVGGGVVLVEGEGRRGDSMEDEGEEGREERVLRASLATLQHQPRDFEALIAAGKAYVRQASRILSSPAESADAAGTAGEETSLLKEALRCFRTAAVVRPCDPTPHLHAAQVLLTMGGTNEYEQAKALIHTAEEEFFTASSPTCPFPSHVPHGRVLALLAEARLRFARFFIQAGDEVEGRRALAEVLALRPTYLEAHQLLVTMLREVGNGEEAREAMRRALVALGPRGQDERVVKAFEGLLTSQTDVKYDRTNLER